MRQRQTLVRDNTAALEQVTRLLEGLDDEEYARAVPQLASTGIGSHVRHCVDFYVRLFDGLAPGRVDYDARERDERLERDRKHAVARLREIAVRLAALADVGGDVPLRVRMDSAGDSAADVPWSASSLDRELQSLLSHTVHHCALIAMLLRFAGQEPAAGFGVAPSTLRHWQETGACAR